MSLIIGRRNNSWNKVSTEKKLREDLNEISGLLNDNTIEYLESLINLDCSAIDNSVSYKEKELLLKIDLYKKIAIYNIYKRTANIFRNKSNIELSGNNNGIEGLYAYYEGLEDEIELFSFDYRKADIGNINLNRIVIDDNEREKELESIMKTLEALYDAKNPFHDAPGAFGGPASRWYYDHQRQISEYEELFKKLDGKEITDEEKKAAEISQKYYKRVMKDFHLKEDDFHELESSFIKRKKETGKILVKKLPGITISSETKYI